MSAALSLASSDAMKDALEDAKTLIRTVARAFYTDTYIVVLDLLLRESMVLFEQIGPRLRLPMKQVEEVIRDLESQMMIKSEAIKNEETKDTFQYYYIDYQISVLAIFFRIRRMKDILNSKIKEQVRTIQYHCPTCRKEYSQFVVPGLLSRDMQFVCSSCCPEDDYRDCDTREYPDCAFKLVEVDTTHTETSLTRTKNNLEAQLNEVEGRPLGHLGIMTLLHRLKSKVLPRNLPSENIKHGQFASKVKDEDVQAKIADEMNNMASGRTGGHSSINNRKKAATTQYIYDDHGKVIGMQAATASERHQMAEELQRKQAAADKGSGGGLGGGGGGGGGYSGGGLSAADLFQRQEITKTLMAHRDTAIPEFLGTSGVYGADESIKQATSLQRERQEAAQRLAQQQALTSAMPLSAMGTGLMPEVERVHVDTTSTAAAPTLDDDHHHHLDGREEDEPEAKRR
eukprot:gene1439-1041_t